MMNDIFNHLKSDVSIRTIRGAGYILKTAKVSNVINNIILPMEPILLEKNIKFSHYIEPNIIIDSDSEKIKQVVEILLDNAIKYTNENGHINISLVRLKNQVVYSITNSGKGIAKEDLPKIFDRFYRSDPSRAHEISGYGLGLSIAKTIIDKLGGKIRVTSIENEYTTFIFTLIKRTVEF